MFYLKFVSDGFKVIIGPWIVHMAQFLTLMIMIRPPDYEDDEEKTRAAHVIYGVLIAGHFGIGAMKYYTMHVNGVLSPIYSVLMLSCVITLVYLCDKWIYIPDALPISSLTEK